jgi:hypothetical protein
VHACVGPTSSTRAGGDAPLSDSMSCISLFYKIIIVTDFTDISRPVAIVVQ